MDRNVDGSTGHRLRDSVDAVARWIDTEQDGARPRADGQLDDSLSELRNAEEEFRQQNEELISARHGIEVERERFRELFEFAPDAYLVTDPKGVVRDANLAAEDLFMRSRSSIIGKPLRIFVSQEEKSPYYDLMQQLNASGRVEDLELRIRPNTTTRRHVSVAARVYPASGAPVTGIRWQLRDITQRIEDAEQIRQMNADLEERVRERTAELERANAAKDEFLGLISHELKTPITVIGGNAAALTRLGDALSAKQKHDSLADILKESHRLNRIIDNLLILARLERGRSIELEPVRLDLLVAHRVDDHRAADPLHAIEFVSDGPATVEGADLYIEQVVDNFIANAAKYSPAASTISVELRHDGDEAIVSVSDRGGGVPEDELPDIFTAFYRSPRTSGDAPGVGIGLAVCRRLVEAQHGRAWASHREGGGMHFCFALPRMTEAFKDHHGGDEPA